MRKIWKCYKSSAKKEIWVITQKNGGKEAKMQRDGSLEISGWETPNSPGNVFEESSKSDVLKF